MAIETGVPSQCRGWLTAYYVYLLIAATLCLMEVIGSRPWGNFGWSHSPLPAGPFVMAIFKLGVYVFAANSLKRVGTRWVAHFHIGLNAVSALVACLFIFGYATSLSVPTLIPWPLIIYFQHPFIYPVLPLAWTIYWVVSKRVKTVYPATGTSDVKPIWIRTRGLTEVLSKWSTRAWVIAILIVAMTTLVPWAIYAYPVLVISFANPGGDRWPLIYFAYPLILLATWAAAYMLLSRNKFRAARIVAAMPVALFVLLGAADLQSKVAPMQWTRVDWAESIYDERNFEAARRAGKPEGPFTEFHDNGQKKIEGNYDDNGDYLGLVTNWDENGQIRSEDIYDRIPTRVDGEETTVISYANSWYDNGQKQEEYRVDRELAWTKDGQLITEIMLDERRRRHNGFTGRVDHEGIRHQTRYLDGSEIGSASWYSNGQKREENRKDMKLAWTEDGQLITEVTLDDAGRYQNGFRGMVHGYGGREEFRYLNGSKILSTWWYPNGQKQRETCGRRVQGKKGYDLKWDESGNLTSPPYDGPLECP